MVGPSLAETDVCQADGAPSEESSETGEGEEPVEDNFTGGSQVHVAEKTESENEYDGKERTSGAIHVGEDLGGVALISKGSEGTRSTINTGYTDGNNGYENDNVHERVETNKASVLASNDEGRGVGVTATTEKALIVGANEKTDEKET